MDSAKCYTIFQEDRRESRNVETMSKYRNEQLNRVLMSRRSVVFKDRKHPTRQKLKQQLKKEKDADRSAGSVMMTPIVIDLEWNRSFPGRRPVEDLPNEIIQIGAAKVDAELNVLATFSELIKPRYYPRLCREITELTLITDADLADAPPFLTVIESFRRWCGSDYVFISWAPNDVIELRRNCRKYGYDTSWIPDCFDAQLMFDDMEMQEDRNWPLNYALFHFNEKPDGMHNALADVMSTVSILKHLDLEEGLSDEYFKVIAYDDGPDR